MKKQSMKKLLTKVVIGSKIAKMMKRIGFVGIILFLGLAGSGFTETVTNQQILEKLNSMDA